MADEQTYFVVETGIGDQAKILNAGKTNNKVEAQQTMTRLTGSYKEAKDFNGEPFYTIEGNQDSGYHIFSSGKNPPAGKDYPRDVVIGMMEGETPLPCVWKDGKASFTSNQQGYSAEGESQGGQRSQSTSGSPSGSSSSTKDGEGHK